MPAFSSSRGSPATISPFSACRCCRCWSCSEAMASCRDEPPSTVPRPAMRLTGNACKAGVMGHPVGHSRSPALHGWWLEHYRVDGAYVPMEVRPENLAAALRALPILGFAGCNLTIPHKEAALALVDRAGP